MPYSIVETPDHLLIEVSGAITGAELHRLIDEAETLLTARPRWTNNLVDLRGLDLGGLGFSDILGFAGRRFAMKPPNPFRTAIVNDSPAVGGYLRMLQNLNRNPSITIEIFDDIAAARTWLAAA